MGDAPREKGSSSPRYPSATRPVRRRRARGEARPGGGRQPAAAGHGHLHLDGVERVPYRTRGRGPALTSMLGSRDPRSSRASHRPPPSLLARPRTSQRAPSATCTRGCSSHRAGAPRSRGTNATAAPAAVRLRNTRPRRPASPSRRRRTSRATTQTSPHRSALGVLLLLLDRHPGRISQQCGTRRRRSCRSAIIVGVAVLARHADPGVRVRAVRTVFLLLSLSLLGLVQFPFGAPVYFCFVAPLGCSPGSRCFGTPPHESSARRLSGVLLAIAVAFGFVVNHGVLYRDGRGEGESADSDPRTGSSLDTCQHPTQRASTFETSALLRGHARGRTSSPAPTRRRSTRSRGSATRRVRCSTPRSIELGAGKAPARRARGTSCHRDSHQLGPAFSAPLGTESWRAWIGVPAPRARWLVRDSLEISRRASRGRQAAGLYATANTLPAPRLTGLPSSRTASRDARTAALSRPRAARAEASTAADSGFAVGAPRRVRTLPRVGERRYFSGRRAGRARCRKSANDA